MARSKLYRYACHLGDYLSGWFIPRDRQLLINGFWRSGTTWLQESLEKKLNARSVFEPLNAHNSSLYQSDRQLGINRCLPEFDVPQDDYSFANLFMPYIADDLEKLPQTYKTLDQALRGQTVMRLYGDRHKTLQDCWRPTVVTKFTRAALSLGAIAKAFAVPIIHLYRDPRAVIASIQTLDGGHFAEDSFNQLSLSDQLLRVNDGRYQYFQQWQSDIEALEHTQATGRIAAYLCLTERYLEDTFEFDDRLKHFKVRYEDLALNPNTAFDALVTQLSIGEIQPASTETSMDTPSVTDWNQAKAQQVSAKDRIFSWKRKLSSYDQGLILDVVKTFRMEDRLWN